MSLLINKSILVIINLLIILYIILLVIDHISANNKITSWSSIFNILSLTFLSIRGFFWLLTMYSTTSWDIFTFYVLYWIPNPIEFSSFMLLPLFFVQIIYPSLWEDYWSYIRPIYITIIIGLVCFQVIWALFVAYEESLVIECSRKSHHLNNRSQCFHTDYSSNVFRLITAFCFLLLASLQAAYAYKIHYMESSQYSRFMISSRNTIALVNCVLFVSFLSRALYQFGTMLDLFHLPNIPLQGDEDVDYKVLICFTIWDYLPTILLITTITSRVIGDNRYYANSILQLGKQINHYTSKTKSGEKRRRAIRGRGRGNSSFLPNQNLMCLQPIDEENPLIQLTNYGTINPIDHDINENTSSEITEVVDQPINKSYSNIFKSNNNNIDKISSDSLKSINKPSDKLFNKLLNSSISYPSTLLSNQYRILYNNSNSLDSKISKDSLINNRNSKESLIELDYDYYDDDIDRCSMDRFDPPSLSALNGVLYITDPIEDPSIQYANNLQQSLSVSLESSHGYINQINKSNSFSTVQSRLNSPIKPSNSSTSLTQVLTYYKRRRGSSIGSDSTTIPSTSPRIYSTFINNLNNKSKPIKSNNNNNNSSKLISENEDKEETKSSNNISNLTINSRIISSHTYRNSPSNLSNSSTVLKEDDYKSAIARPMPIGGSKKPFHLSNKSNLMKNYSIDNLDTIRSENPPPDGSTNTPSRQTLLK